MFICLYTFFSDVTGLFSMQISVKQIFTFQKS